MFSVIHFDIQQETEGVTFICFCNGGVRLRPLATAEASCAL